jgi:hypothetical protein
MGDWLYDSYGDYIVSARRRMSDAWELLEDPTYRPDERRARERHLATACYLAGYAVECELKAYIICTVSTRCSFTEAIQRRRITGLGGRDGHNIGRLWRASTLDGALPPELREDLGTLTGRWSVDLRYRGRFDLPKSQVRERVKSVERLYGWLVERRREAE